MCTWLVLSRWHLLLLSGVGIQAFPQPPSVLASESPRKTKQDKYWGNNVNKRYSKISFSSESPSPMASGSPQQLTHSNWSAHTPLVAQPKDPVPSLQRTDIAVRLARCHVTHTLQQNKAAYIESKTEKDIPMQGDKPSTGCGALYFLVRKCSRPKDHFCAAERGLKDSVHQTAFSNRLDTKDTLGPGLCPQQTSDRQYPWFSYQ